MNPTELPTVLRLLTLSAVALFLSACSSSPNIRFDTDPSADFATFSTYNYYSDAGAGTTSYQSLFSQYMKTAIDIEMQKRGYTMSATPDLLVNFNAQFQDKTKVTTTPAMGGYYGYRGYGAWGGYGMATTTNVSQYTEGTFNIDLVDASKNQLVWEAVGQGRVSEKDMDNMQSGVAEGVPKFFALYPYIAGQGTPVVPADGSK